MDSEPQISPALLAKMIHLIRKLELLNDEIGNRALRHALSEKIVDLGGAIRKASKLT